MIAVKHLDDWSYEETEHWVADSLILRPFCRVYTHPVPHDTTLNRWALLIQPATLHALLDHITHLAKQLKVTRGRKLRVDSTVTETHIRYPTDSRLLADGVRVVSEYRILAGNPPDSEPVLESLAHHRRVFGKPPSLLAGDRGTYSPENERQAKAQGVKHVVLPQKGGTSAERKADERQRWFRAGRRWRTGLEGRISVLKWRHGLDRCLYHDDDGMERWVGWGIIANDLWNIASAVAH